MTEVASFPSDRRFSNISSFGSTCQATPNVLDGNSEMSDDDANVHSPWEGDTEMCSVCSNKLGIMRRHHCRLCGACVCGGCSPSLVHVEGHRRPQRACTPCVAGSQAVPMVKKRLTRLSGHLRDLGGVGGAPAWAIAEAGSLMEAADLCEEALLPVDQAMASARNLADTAEAEANAERHARMEIEAEATAAKEILLSLKQRLSGGPPRPCPRDLSKDAKEEFQRGSLREAAASCEGALAECESQRRSGTWLSKRSKPAGSSVFASWPGTAGEHDARGCDVEQDVPWEDNTANCGVCGDKLGKRLLKPRHHCRLCGRCVCATCSPSMMHLSGGKTEVKRVCTPCVSSAQNATAMTRRIQLLTGRIQTLSGSEIQQVTTPSNMAQALQMCEAAVAPLEEMCHRSDAA